MEFDMKKILIRFILVAMLIGMFSSSSIAADKVVRLRLPLALPTVLPVVTLIDDFVKEVDLTSNHTVQFKIYQPGKLLPPLEIPQAVAQGQVEAGYTSPAYLAGKIPAAPFFMSCPFGPDNIELLSWLYYGNGLKLLQEMYDKYGLNAKVIVLLIPAMESGGWFNKQIKSVEDFRGLRLRWPGLGGLVLAKLGASVSTIPLGETFPALEKGAIDGTELAFPSVDKVIGVAKVSKYNYFPGWHQPSSATMLTINKDVWNRMSKSQQAVVENVAQSITLRSVALSGILDAEAMVSFREKGIQIKTYSPTMLRILQETWNQVAAEESAKDAFFKKVWMDLSDFLKKHRAYSQYTSKLMPD